MKYVEIFKALLAPIIAGVAVLIAWLQYKNARYKIKLDLYEKRYKIYQTIKIIKNVALTKRFINSDELEEFRSNIKEAEFLFEKEINDYITILSVNLIKLTVLKDMNDNKVKSIVKLSKEREEVIKWLINDQEEITKLFKRYLNFENLK